MRLSCPFQTETPGRRLGKEILEELVTYLPVASSVKGSPYIWGGHLLSTSWQQVRTVNTQNVNEVWIHLWDRRI